MIIRLFCMKIFFFVRQSSSIVIEKRRKEKEEEKAIYIEKENSEENKTENSIIEFMFSEVELAKKGKRQGQICLADI